MTKVSPEHFLQVQLIEKIRFELVPIYPELRGPTFDVDGSLRLLAVPNGGGRTIREGVKLKMEGVQSGVPDLQLPIARGGYIGAWLELKAGHGRLSPNQCDWLRFLEDQGHLVDVCWSVGPAFDFLARYMAMEPTARGAVVSTNVLPAG